MQSGSSSKKKGSKASKNRMSNSKSDMEGNSAADSCTLLEYDDDEARNDIQKMKLTFMNKHVMPVFNYSGDTYLVSFYYG